VDDTDYWIRAVVPPDGAWLAALHTTRAFVVVRRLTEPGPVVASLEKDSARYLTDVAVHPSGRCLAVASNDETVKLYDTATWQPTRTLTWDIGRLRSVTFSPDGTRAAVGSATGRVVVWDVDL
jgi:WD40 repeat protein